MEPVLAHGIAGRADLPIPAEWFGVAAAAVLVISFVGLAAGWTTPRLEQPRERRLFALGRWADVVLGTVGVAAFAVTVYAGLAGTDDQRDNLAPTAVYVGFWVGVAFASLLVGDVWRLLSPWRALGRATGWATGRLTRGGADPLAYPERLGHWPAAIGIFAFGMAELTWAPARDPAPLAVLMLVYLAIQAAGMGLYGVDAWTRRGDAFGVWFSLLARLAPITRREGVLYLRPPGAGAPELRALRGTAAVLVAGIGITAFDGALEGPVFNAVAPDVQRVLADAGMSLGAALEWTFLGGMVICVALIAAIYAAAVSGMPRTPGATRTELARRFAHGLIPIAAAYLVAHYFSLLAYNGQDLWRLVRQPLDGGGTGPQIDYGLVSATAIWYVQVTTLVLGHVGGLVLSHDRALTIYGSARAAVRSQVVMLAVMVSFTCLGLYLLSAANA
jgi:hypothetical protein